MNQRFSLAALGAACALTLASCNAAPAEIARPTAATAKPVAAVGDAAGEQTFGVNSPPSDATIARHAAIRGWAPTSSHGGRGPGYFGGDDTPEGAKFKLRARLLRADNSIISEQTVTNLTRTNAPINASQALAQPLVMGYYPSYRAALAPDELHDDRFTDIIYSFAKVDDKGVLDAQSYAAFPAFVATVHAKNSRAILGLSGGGNGDDFAIMVRDTQKRAQFVAAIGQLMKTTKADGLALDWEQPTPEDKPLTTQLARELRAAMKAANPDAKLILVVNSSAYNSRGYDGPALRDNVDYLHIMSYDFHGPWNHAGHHTNLFATSADKEDGDAFSYPKALQYWRETQGFPADKILMGLAGYGRGFRAPDWGAKSTGESQYPEISYADIQGLIGHGWTREWDAQAHAPWLLSDDGSQRISYDDTRSASDKADWMKQQHLAGFFIWELTQEEVGGDNVLTAAALQAWQKAPPAD